MVAQVDILEPVVALVALNIAGSTRPVLEVVCREPLTRLELWERFSAVLGLLVAEEPKILQLLEQQGFELRLADPEEALR
jgi:hypothetical protein